MTISSFPISCGATPNRWASRLPVLTPAVLSSSRPAPVLQASARLHDQSGPRVMPVRVPHTRRLACPVWSCDRHRSIDDGPRAAEDARSTRLGGRHASAGLNPAIPTKQMVHPSAGFWFSVVVHPIDNCSAGGGPEWSDGCQKAASVSGSRRLRDRRVTDRRLATSWAAGRHAVARPALHSGLDDHRIPLVADARIRTARRKERVPVPAADSCMPVRLVEEVESLEEALTLALRVVLEVIADGRIDRHEVGQLDQAFGQVALVFTQVKLGALDIVAGARLLKTIADTFAITPWVGRRLREIEDDRSRLTAWTATGSYLDVVSGRLDGLEAA